MDPQAPKPKRPHAPERRSTHHVSTTDVLAQPWSTTWRKAVVSLPRAIPDKVLRWTSPDGPHPIPLKVPSRDPKRSIPVYVFIPPSVTESRLSKLNPAPTQAINCPVLLDFHGGGFILGSCQEQVPFCAKLCKELSCISISVDYQLGPYAKFPAAVHDAEDVLNAVTDPQSAGYYELRESINGVLSKASKPHVTFDTEHLAFSGFSSGGSLALNLLLSLPRSISTPSNPATDIKETWPSPIPQAHTAPIPVLLFYPALDTRLLPDERPLPPGMSAPKSFWSSLNLEGELMPTYLPKHMTSHPRASPGLNNTSIESGILHHATRAFLVLPENDTLAASNELWASRMVKEGRGNDLFVERVKDCLHGWTQFPDSWLDEESRKKKAEVFNKTVQFVRNVWTGNDDVNATTQDRESKAGVGGVKNYQGKKIDFKIAEEEWKTQAQQE